MALDRKRLQKDYEVIDSAWDHFSEYIGQNNINTPLNLEQFEEIFQKLNQNGKYGNKKEQILESFRYDSYSWPLVERK